VLEVIAPMRGLKLKLRYKEGPTARYSGWAFFVKIPHYVI
jgi:hypothetical protein